MPFGRRRTLASESAGSTVEISDRGGGRFAASTARAAISMSLSDRVRAFAFDHKHVVMLAVPRVYASPPGVTGFNALGLDTEAIGPNDREGYLYDFGLGVGSSGFGVRTADLSLRHALDACVGDPWPKVLAAAGRRIIQISPPRVVVTPIGRIEVFTRIPSPGELAPPGPHTHFLPELLAAGRETVPGMELPEAYLSCLIYYPG
jgi:hypothetical protein